MRSNEPSAMALSAMHIGASFNTCVRWVHQCSKAGRDARESGATWPDTWDTWQFRWTRVAARGKTHDVDERGVDGIGKQSKNVGPARRRFGVYAGRGLRQGARHDCSNDRKRERRFICLHRESVMYIYVCRMNGSKFQSLERSIDLKASPRGRLRPRLRLDSDCLPRPRQSPSLQLMGRAP